MVFLFCFFSRECPNFSSRAPRPAPGLSGPISAHARGERRGTDASPSLKFALIIVKIFYKIIFGGSVGRGRAASEGREGREGKPAGAAPRPAAASALRCPREFCPDGSVPPRSGPRAAAGPAGSRASPGGASVPIPLRQANIARGGGAKARRNPHRGGDHFFGVFILFGFATLDDIATATQCLTLLRLNLEEVFFSKGVLSVNRRLHFSSKKYLVLFFFITSTKLKIVLFFCISEFILVIKKKFLLHFHHS